MENKKTCELCRDQISNNNFERLDFAKIRNLKTLLKLDTTINEQTVICSRCADVWQESFNFKNACLRNGDYLKTFTRPTDESKLILEDVILKTIKSEVKCVEERVCRFCLNYFEVNSLVEINAEENITLKNMLGRCLPEIDMSIVQNPLICYVCSKLLEKLFNFISRYNDTEVLGNLDTKTDLIIVKKEEIFEHIENPEIQIKSENFNIDEDVKDSVNDRYKIWSCEEEKLETYKWSISASNKHDIVRRSRRGHKDQTQLKYSCDLCPHQTNNKSSLKMHYLVHQDLTEKNMVKCDKCPYVTKWKSGLLYHYKRWHENVSNLPRYNCDECPYKTIWRWRFIRHRLIHKDPSEIKMYKCVDCSHETKRKSSLKIHEITHARNRDKTKKKKFVCDICSFRVETSYRLKQHYLKHKQPSEITIFKCECCPFATKWKANLTLHAIGHRNPSEVPQFKCNDCPYETNKKSYIVRHVLVHKHPLEVVMFQCKECPYETKYKRRISVHEKTHEGEVYMCSECSYKTKFKNYLMKHVLCHKEQKQPVNQNLTMSSTRAASIHT